MIIIIYKWIIFIIHNTYIKLHLRNFHDYITKVLELNVSGYMISAKLYCYIDTY